MSGPQTQHKGVVYLLTAPARRTRSPAPGCALSWWARRTALTLTLALSLAQPRPEPEPEPEPQPPPGPDLPRLRRDRGPPRPGGAAASGGRAGAVRQRGRVAGPPSRGSQVEKKSPGECAFARSVRVCPPRMHPRRQLSACCAYPSVSRRGACSASCRRPRSRRPSVSGSPERRIRCPPAFRPRRLRLRRRRRCSSLGLQRRCSLLGLQRHCSSLGLQHRCGSPARPTLTRARRRRLHRRVTSTRSSRR